ncbi:MAG: hypothetical protein ACXVFT_00020 [Solirubrobacteraceae bacterium]
MSEQVDVEADPGSDDVVERVDESPVARAEFVDDRGDHVAEVCLEVVVV